MSLTGECRRQKTPSTHYSHRRNVEYLYGWIKKKLSHAKISPKVVNPRDIAGNAEEEYTNLKELDSATPHCNRCHGFVAAVVVVAAAAVAAAAAAADAAAAAAVYSFIHSFVHLEKRS